MRSQVRNILCALQTAAKTNHHPHVRKRMDKGYITHDLKHLGALHIQSHWFWNGKNVVITIPPPQVTQYKKQQINHFGSVHKVCRSATLRELTLSSSFYTTRYHLKIIQHMHILSSATGNKRTISFAWASPLAATSFTIFMTSPHQPQASLQFKKINSTIYTPSETLMTTYVKGFYLNTPVDIFDYMWIHLHKIPGIINKK